jgi:hypothetical protein
MNRTRKTNANNSSVISVRIENPNQFQRIFRKGGMKVMIAVSDDTCPHCVKYKPTWETLAKTEGRNVPMISMPSSVYNQTHLAKQKEVKGVPTVLYVSPNGTVNEVEDIRDESKMTSLLRSNTDSEKNIETVIPTEIPIIEPNEPKANEPKANEPKALQIPGLTDAALPTIPVSQVKVNRPITANMTSGNSGNVPVNKPRNIIPNKPTNALKPVLPGVTTQPNPLTPLPGSPVASETQSGGAYGNHLQVGGNPWTAFMMAAKQAAPAAALLGAYSMLPQRSSGLGRPRSRKSKSRRQRGQDAPK